MLNEKIIMLQMKLEDQTGRILTSNIPSHETQSLVKTASGVDMSKHTQ